MGIWLVAVLIAVGVGTTGPARAQTIVVPSHNNGHGLPGEAANTDCGWLGEPACPIGDTAYYPYSQHVVLRPNRYDLVPGIVMDERVDPFIRDFVVFGYRSFCLNGLVAVRTGAGICSLDIRSQDLTCAAAECRFITPDAVHGDNDVLHLSYAAQVLGCPRAQPNDPCVVIVSQRNAVIPPGRYIYVVQSHRGDDAKWHMDDRVVLRRTDRFVDTAVVCVGAKSYVSPYNPIDPANNIYAPIRHSQLNGGNASPVFAAGEMLVGAQGIIKISNGSGHYQPPLQLNANAEKILRGLKVRFAPTYTSIEQAGPLDTAMQESPCPLAKELAPSAIITIVNHTNASQNVRVDTPNGLNQTLTIGPNGSAEAHVSADITAPSTTTLSLLESTCDPAEGDEPGTCDATVYVPATIGALNAPLPGQPVRRGPSAVITNSRRSGAVTPFLTVSPGPNAVPYGATLAIEP